MRVRRSKIASASVRRTVAYVRVSTEDQATTGVSLDAQEARIAAYALAMGFEVSEVVRDAGVSAKTLKRPGITRVLRDVRSGEIERVVIVSLDRITRSTRDLADLLDMFAKADAALVSISESLDTLSAAGRMVVNLLGVVNQWQREAIAEKTKDVLAHKRSIRKVYGSTPFGYLRVGEDLVVDPAEQRALEEMRRMDAAGASYREIGRMLEARSILPKQGAGRWHASSVRSVLRSKSSLQDIHV